MSSSDTITWVSWPLRDEPPRKTILLLALLGLTVALSAMMALIAGLLAALLLFILLGPYFLPTRYRRIPASGSATSFHQAIGHHRYRRCSTGRARGMSIRGMRQ